MAMSKTVKHEVKQLVQFLEPLEDDFKCPICYEILQEPHLTTCCGNHHLCKGCMKNVKRANGRCPLCQQKPFDGFIDKRFERQLNDLRVYCIYKSKGCEWIGNFGKIEQHLNTGKENGECQFVVVECPVSVECKEYFLRKNLKNHLSNVCKYRPAKCKYCGFVSTYQNITSLHFEKCTKYPLFCPNKCSSQTYPRNQLSTHLASCPEQEMDCTFSEMGCKEKIKRRALQEHLDTNLLQHQLIMCQAFKEMKKDKQEVEEQLELLKRDKKELEVKVQDMHKFSNQEDNQIRSLKFIAIEKYQSLYFSKMAEFSDCNPVAPLVFKASFEVIQVRQGQLFNAVNHFTAQPYKSPFFYSHPNGYKLQLSAEIVCHCSNCVKQPRPMASLLQSFSTTAPYTHSVDTNPSVNVNLYIFKGDHDSELKWPFKEEVTITIIQEKKFHSAERVFGGNRNHTSNGIKLGIKSLHKKIETDIIASSPLIPLPSHQASARVELLPTPSDEAQGYRNEEQQKISVPTEDDLTFPLNISARNMPQQVSNFHQNRSFPQSNSPRRNNETVLFEVTFSSQLLH